MSITFDVSEVEPDPSPLGPADLGRAFAARGVRGVLAADAGDHELVDALPLHGLAMALHLAYQRHRPLTLSPDDVWLCIAQGLARHVEANAEALRPRLVAHQGKLPLEVRRDEILNDPSAAGEWAVAIDGLVEHVRAHLGGRASLFVSSFSTTDRASRIASQITLLGAMQSYFEYTIASLCGIPKVTLLGTVADWRDVRARARVLGELDLERWASRLDPVLEAIERTAAGRVDVEFWRRIYKEHHASGGESISGWVNVLFPFLGDRGTQPNPWVFADDEPENELEMPKLRDLPSGLASAPFSWRLLTEERPMQLVSGFVGVSRARDDGVRPAIGWCVAPASPERRFRAIPGASGPEAGAVRMTPRDGKRLTTLRGLAEEIAYDRHDRVALSLSWCDALEDLEGIEGIDAIEEVSLLSCGAIRDLAPLTRLPRLRTLWVQQCAAVIDVSPLTTLTSLETLALTHNPALVDYRPLAALAGSRLQQLDLFGASVPAAVQGRHVGVEAVAAALARLA
jgi:hypothetical protein